MSIAQVAKYAGVSSATVSRVLNSVPVVSETTVQSVRAAIKAVKYDPFEVKRGPKPGSRRHSSTKKVGTIAVMAVGSNRDKLRCQVTDGVVQAIIRAAKQCGIRVLLDEMPNLHDLSAIIQNREVDGAVVFLADEAPLKVLTEIHRQVPVVWAMGGQAGPLQVDHVSENNLAIGYLAQEYLDNRGCFDLAFLSIVPQKRNAMQRGQSFACAAAEKEHASRALVMTNNSLIAGLYGVDTLMRPTLSDLVDAFASLSPRPTGLFIDRDSTTAKVYPLLMRAGIQPGRDVTIISCDNEELALSALYPRPASIDLGTAEIGGRVVQRLLLRIENRDEPPVCIQAIPSLQLSEDETEVEIVRSRKF